MRRMDNRGRAVTLFVENAREQTVTLEERKFEVNKLQALCEARSLRVVGWRRTDGRVVSHTFYHFSLFNSHMMDFMTSWQTLH